MASAGTPARDRSTRIAVRARSRGRSSFSRCTHRSIRPDRGGPTGLAPALSWVTARRLDCFDFGPRGRMRARNRAKLPRAGVAPAPPGFHPSARLSSCRGVTPSEGIAPSPPRLTAGRSAVELRRHTPGRAPHRPGLLRPGCQRARASRAHDERRARELHPDFPVQSRTSCCWTSAASSEAPGSRTLIGRLRAGCSAVELAPRRVRKRKRPPAMRADGRHEVAMMRLHRLR